MVMGPPVLERAASTLLDSVPSGASSRTDDLAFVSIEPVESGPVAAVDGGQSIVADLGACGIIALRAGFCVRNPHGVFIDVKVRDAFRVVNRKRAALEWAEVAHSYGWGDAPPPATDSAVNWVRSWCEAERVLAEGVSALAALETLEAGRGLLLLDGALEHESATTPRVLAAARVRGIPVIAVSKDTSLTLGGLLPFTLELELAAARRDAPPRFFVDVTDALALETGARTYACRWDPRSPLYRVDVAADETDHRALLARVLGLCDDVAYAGYPYPLARVHERIHYPDHEAADLKHRLESLVAQRRGSLFSMRLFGRGRDVLALGG